MRPLARNVRLAAGVVLMTLALAPGDAAAKKAQLPPQPIDPAARVDHDAQPIPKPRDREKNLYSHQVREAIVEPLSHAFDVPDKIQWLMGKSGHKTANVNAFDEVSNSSWFTNRNHVRALSLEAIRLGVAGKELLPAPPYTIKARKKGGVNPGFTIKDANDKRWIVKLDKPGYPQLGSGADVVVGHLFWAAGFNVSHDVMFKFRRDELKIDADLKRGKDKEPPFVDADLDTLLLRGHKGDDGKYYGQASLYLEGMPVGPLDARSKRPDDPNDRFKHRNRRELRGLYVLESWVGSWDTKDQQSLDTFIESKDSLGFVRHHLLDFGASLGAAAEGPRPPERGYEFTIDGKAIGLRFLTLGLYQEKWRKIPRDVPIPSLGSFESTVYEPDKFKTLQPHAAFRERLDGDDYWGAKLVASFSDAQIAAAIDAAGYEDPRVKPALLKLLVERRDKVMRFYFDRVAPLDFFYVSGGDLRFRDLAVDRRIAADRAYEVRIEGDGAERTLTLNTTTFDLSGLGSRGQEVDLDFHIAGSRAEPVTVTLQREGGSWKIARVRHA
jgi:hypothetical protein